MQFFSSHKSSLNNDKSQQQANICQLFPIFFLFSHRTGDKAINKKLINQNGRKMRFKDSFQPEAEMTSIKLSCARVHRASFNSAKNRFAHFIVKLKFGTDLHFPR